MLGAEVQNPVDAAIPVAIGAVLHPVVSDPIHAVGVVSEVPFLYGAGVHCAIGGGGLHDAIGGGGLHADIGGGGLHADIGGSGVHGDIGGVHDAIGGGGFHEDNGVVVCVKMSVVGCAC